MIKKYRGIHFNRLKAERNYAERIFAEEWARINKVAAKDDSTLFAHIVSSSERVAPEPSPRDHQVAATLVQWLGTEVGIRWLRETIKKVDSEDYRRCFEARRK